MYAICVWWHHEKTHRSHISIKRSLTSHRKCLKIHFCIVQHFLRTYRQYDLIFTHERLCVIYCNTCHMYMVASRKKPHRNHISTKLSLTSHRSDAESMIESQSCWTCSHNIMVLCSKQHRSKIPVVTITNFLQRIKPEILRYFFMGLRYVFS